LRGPRPRPPDGKTQNRALFPTRRVPPSQSPPFHRYARSRFAKPQNASPRARCNCAVTQVTAPSWQWESGVIVPSRAVEAVYLFALFRYRSGAVHFDDVTLRTLTPSEVCNGAHRLLNHSAITVAYTEDTPIVHPASGSE